MITEKRIKTEFSKAEQSLNFCWDLLVDIKTSNIQQNDFAARFITFQDKLATTIFTLQSIRDKIIIEEKTYVLNKGRYNFDWFKRRMKQLSNYKKAIDSVVNISKAHGDAYAYFFYQSDLELLTEHLYHQRIINHTAGIGERGELEFIKSIKHVEGQFTLFHGITNILRYGDFSFIDLKAMKVTQIGELKTKKIDDSTLEFSLSLFKRRELEKKKETPATDIELVKTRRGRQVLGIANFLKGNKDPNIPNEDRDVVNQSYFKEIETLLEQARIGRYNSVQVSPGLAFTSVKLKTTNLYRRFFKRDAEKSINASAEGIKDTAINLIKRNSNGNGIILGELLYNLDFSDKNTPGTVPLFWYHIKPVLLKQLYFGDCFIMSIFNPIHLIEEIQGMGFKVESKYLDKSTPAFGPHIGTIERFDLFISYIINHLLTERFVTDIVSQLRESAHWGVNKKITIKPQQRMPLFVGRPRSR